MENVCQGYKEIVHRLGHFLCVWCVWCVWAEISCVGVQVASQEQQKSREVSGEHFILLYKNKQVTNTRFKTDKQQTNKNENKSNNESEKNKKNRQTQQALKVKL